MRVVYLFESLGNAERPQNWDPTVTPSNKSASGIVTEGFWYLWKELLERNIIDEVLVIIESARGPGKKRWNEHFNLLVIPHIDQAEEFLRKDDILFVRSGFRSWFVFLERLRPEKRWVLFYRAASNRLKWNFWDIVIEDVTDKSFVFGDRLHYRFNKPIHPGVFSFRRKMTRDLDVMFHASHIHDKKGQWKCVEAAIAYHAMYGSHFHGVMPGGFYGGEKTRVAYDRIKEFNLPIWIPGMVPREDLNRWMNRSKIYLHLGGAGQNDRGNLEAMLCGCQQIVGSPKYHAPFVYENPEISRIVSETDSPEKIAETIHEMLLEWKPTFPEKVSEYYHRVNGVDVAVKQMEILFGFLRRHPIADRAKAIRELIDV